jgi:prolipoprotein diacylglyceryltransferase
MKPMAIAGIVLVVLGAFVGFRGLSYNAQRSVMKVGDLQVSADEQRAIPTWVGGVAIVGGVLLVAASARRRRGA